MVAGRILLFAPHLNDHACTGVEQVSDPVVAVLDSALRAGRETGELRVAVIPEGPYVVPFCRSGPGSGQ